MIINQQYIQSHKHNKFNYQQFDKVDMVLIISDSNLLPWTQKAMKVY